MIIQTTVTPSRIPPTPPATRFFGPAEIVNIDLATRCARVLLRDSLDESALDAILALPYPCSLAPGDEVLIIGERGGTQTTYTSSASFANRSRPLPNAARPETPREKPALQIETDPITHKTTVKIPAGDLEFTTEAGNITFKSAQNIRFIAAHDIVTTARNLYQTVSELLQLRTNRFRALISSTFHLKSKNTFMNAEEDCKINADQIHLG